MCVRVCVNVFVCMCIFSCVYVYLLNAFRERLYQFITVLSNSDLSARAVE